MIVCYVGLRQRPAVFQTLTGLRLDEFAALLDDLCARFQQAEDARHARPDRKRAPGAGGQFKLPLGDQLLLTLLWLRHYPTYEVLAYLFGVSDTTAGRVVQRLLPLLEDDARCKMHLPAAGQRSRRGLDALLAETPSFALLVDSFEQPVQRPKDPAAQRRHYSGKKKRHTLKSQVAVDEWTGELCDIPESVPGPTNDLVLLQASGLLARLPEGVGVITDQGYPGITRLHPAAVLPRRKPRCQPRPPEDVAFNRALARRRVLVERRIGRLKRYAAVCQPDRHHRRYHTARVRAVAGLVNRQLWSRGQ
jgi:DDE superfamily endonuclease